LFQFVWKPKLPANESVQKIQCWIPTNRQWNFFSSDAELFDDDHREFRDQPDWHGGGDVSYRADFDRRGVLLRSFSPA
jgi:hypothetical protein